MPRTRLSPLLKPVSGAPLATVRFYFGLLMLVSLIRFVAYGWVEKLYLEPTWHFHYAGFEWVQPLGIYTYGLFALSGLAAIGLMLAHRYRLSALVFFLSFTYIELMDKTTYLNHYYFISVLAFLLCWLPAHHYGAPGAGRKKAGRVPYYTVGAVKLLVGLVYFYAGLAKLNSDWLLQAQPLATWLPGRTDLPLLGSFLDQTWVAYFFSWAGAAFDLSAPFLLLYRRTRSWTYAVVVLFHILTWLLFPIGMFPFIMIGAALIFFPGAWHERVWQRLAPSRWLPATTGRTPQAERGTFGLRPNVLPGAVIGFLLLGQLVLPWRYLAQPGELFWHEEGFRFSWRVMLMEKAGYAQFWLENPRSGRRQAVQNHHFLTAFQEKQMSFQPDMMREYAQLLARHYRQSKNWDTVAVYADVYVALNGRPSRRYVKPEVDLTQVSSAAEMLLPFDDTITGL
jgi:hypothetical protein